MKIKGMILAGIAATFAVGIIASFWSYQADLESLNLDMGRKHGTILTAMGSPVYGSESAPVTIVEFGDYQCHQCYNWFQNTKPAIFENYVEAGKVRMVFVDLAFLGRDSPKAAQASYCAEEQGQYWKYHDLLYSNQQTIDDGWADSERLKAFAFSLDLDMELFESCLDSGKFGKRVQFNVDEAKKQGAEGTPTFIIIGADGNQQKLVGAQPYSVFEQVLDSML